MCNDDIVIVRVIRGGWERSPGGGLKGGAPAGDEAFVFHNENETYQFVRTTYGYTCDICKLDFARIGQHISTKQCGDGINIGQFKKALKKYQMKMRVAKHREKDPEAYAEKNRKRVTQAQTKRKHDDPQDFARKHPESMAKTNKKIKDDDNLALKRFQKANRYGPIFVCSCCYTRQFQDNSIMMKKLKVDPNVLSKCVPKGQEVLVKIWLNDDKTEEAYVCKTCKRYLEKGKMPPECRQNNLQLDPQPDVMKLTELESNLIARNIQFQKIYQLPKSRYTAIKDKIINVPVPEDSVLNTIKSLPRTPNEAGLIGLELKRKLEYSNPHQKAQMIDPNKIYKAMEYLKNAGNPYYQFYDDFHAYEERCVGSDDNQLIANALHEEEENLTEILKETPTEKNLEPEDKLEEAKPEPDDEPEEKNPEPEEEPEDGWVGGTVPVSEWIETCFRNLRISKTFGTKEGRNKKGRKGKRK